MKGCIVSVVFTALLFLLPVLSYADPEMPAESFGKEWEHYIGPQTGIIHPFMAFTGFYTDNVYNSDVRKDSDGGGVYSPGIWMAFPRIKTPLLKFESSAMTPGGVRLKRSERGDFRRFQGFLSYRADIWRYGSEKDADKTEHHLAGALQYNMPFGLQTELLGAYIVGHDEWGETLRRDLSPYDAFYGGIRMLYDLSRKTDLRLDFRYYDVDYDRRIDDFKDRSDFIVSPYFYYKFSPKISFFIQYKYLDISYDTNKIYNSTEHHFYSGVKWKVTHKTKGELKGGYARKKYENVDGNNADYFFVLGKGDYRFSRNTSVDLNISRQSEETPIYGYKNVLTTDINSKINYKITGKTSLHLELGYKNESYDAGDGGWIQHDRDDDTFKVSPYILWKYKPWFNTKLGYRFEKRDSNVYLFDYTGNTVWLTLYFTL